MLGDRVATAERPPGAGVPDAVAPPPRHPRFELVDGLRALAVLAVVAVHAWVAARGTVGTSPADRLLAHMNIGVTLFFVLSGFLLCRPFIAHRAAGSPPPAVRDYARRRVLRIYPAYWLALTALTLAPGLVGVRDGGWLAQYASVDALLAGDGGSCVEAIFDCGLAQTWSLAVEITFYAALPLYALGAARLLRGLPLRRWVVAQLGLLAGLSVASIALRFAGTDDAWVAYSLLGSGLWFALGMGLAVASVALHGRGLGRRPGLAWLAAAAGYGALAALLPVTPFLLATEDQLLAHVGFGAVALLVALPAVFDGGTGLPRRVLGHPAIAWLGLISYGVFLWHFVVTLELDGAGRPFPVVLAVTLAVSVPLAAASYYALERPLLRLKHRR